MPPKGAKGAKAARTIFNAAEDGDFVGIGEYLARDASSLESRNSDGWTPLHAACYNDQLDSVEALVKAGADVNALCKDGDTPLHYACAQGAVNVVKYLGALPKTKLEVTDADGETPLDVAQNAKVKKALEALIAARESAAEEGEGEDDVEEDGGEEDDKGLAKGVKGVALR